MSSTVACNIHAIFCIYLLLCDCKYTIVKLFIIANMNNNALWARLKGLYIYGHAALNKKGSIVHFMCLCHKTQRYFTFPAGLQPMAFCPWRIWCVALKISSLGSLCAWFLPYTAYLLTAPLEAMDPAAWWIPCEVSSYRHSQRNYMFSAIKWILMSEW